MAQKSKGCGKVHTMMLTQQLDHLGMSVDDLGQRIAGLGAQQWAYIVHDKDVSEDGSAASDHVHAALYFKNARSVSSVARKCGVDPQYVEKWDAGQQSRANAFSYLTHRTTNARSKYQYDPAAVCASFDYPSWLEDQTVKAENKRERFGARSKASFVLDAVFDGEMTADEAAENLSGHEYARISRQLRDLSAYRQGKAVEGWRREHAGDTLNVIWIYGASGVGKTRMAKEIASGRGPYFLSGSTRDPWAGYTPDRHTAILDELRPGVMSYADLLRVTDPYSIRDGVSAPARYRDVPIACDLIIVTTPFNPFSFWRNCAESGGGIDGFGQLERRITLTLQLTKTGFWAEEFDYDVRLYKPVQSTVKPNPYLSSTTARRDPADVYNEFI